jgi:drug/metabolite transporter (DMT)-like permease
VTGGVPVSSGVTPTLLASAPAIVLAVVAAACFAVAATLQHGAIDTVSEDDGGRLGLAAFRALLRRPGWLIGLATAGAGSGLHAVALVLSPLAVVQPIGVLAVPIAVLLTVRRTRESPGRGVLLGVALCVIGVAAFVVIAANSTTSTRVPDFATLIAGGISLALVLVLVAVAALSSGWIRCVAWVTAGAVAFGLVSALVRALSLQVTTGLVGLTDPRFLVTAAGIATALVVGGWLVQQGFATGAPEVVIACLTVVDPIVAVLLGILLLGEGPATNGLAALVLILCALAAAAGVVSLARYHPDARRARAAARAAGPASRS